MRSAARSCIVFAPHPDDETLGCGATIRLKREAGASVKVVIATDGRCSHMSDEVGREELVRLRQAEAVAACAILGVPAVDVDFLGYADGSLSQSLPELTDRIEQLIVRLRPDEVLVSSSVDPHPDHQALNQALRAAVGDRLSQTLGRGRTPIVAEYTIGTRGRSALRLLARVPPPRLIRTVQAASAKQAAIGKYRTQTTNLKGREPGGIILDAAALARYSGPYEVFFPLDP